jgi:hypothetical protein
LRKIRKNVEFENIVHELQIVETMYSSQELADMHFMYGLVDVSVVSTRRSYQERYPGRKYPDRNPFVKYSWQSAPRVARRGRPRYTTAEVEEEIVDVVNEAPGTSTRTVSVKVGVAHSAVCRVLREQQLYPCHLQRAQALSLQDYPARVIVCR